MHITPALRLMLVVIGLCAAMKQEGRWHTVSLQPHTHTHTLPRFRLNISELSEIHLSAQPAAVAVKLIACLVHIYFHEQVL